MQKDNIYTLNTKKLLISVGRKEGLRDREKSDKDKISLFSGRP